MFNIYMSNQELALNNQQQLICPKTWPNETELFEIELFQPLTVCEQMTFN